MTTIAKRLRDAREGLGLTLEAVSLRTGLGISTLSDFEKGKREPSVSQLAMLGKDYNRSIAYFLGEQTVPEPVVLWRERPEIESVKREQEARFRQFCEQYRHLESWCDDIKHPSLPSCKINADRFTEEDAENLADDVRKQLGLGEYPAYALQNALENSCGIKIFHDKSMPSGTAACVVSDSYGMAILLNSNHAWYRRHFDLAHELFHLLTWDTFRTFNRGILTAESRVADSEEERYANQFARSLLMPREPLQKAVGRHINASRIPALYATVAMRLM